MILELVGRRVEMTFEGQDLGDQVAVPGRVIRAEPGTVKPLIVELLGGEEERFSIQDVVDHLADQ